ncbi:ARM repeat-containing protein [Massarina eburnea CBS 473.64]|uniref:Pumilio homology domain family member 3 n=1 Tax=Massarina eburnea CBS 473.64 TaxID=1395130 RepID=A0A6A6S1G4_9PLEO|nr:ARM repeat-containing protein [Massarina eburnea CBS 473.64]
MTNTVGADPRRSRPDTDRILQTRTRDFNAGVALNGPDADRPSHTTLGWGGSIWNSNSISAAFGSTARDSSQPRSNSVYEPIEGKTGSGSLVPSSETDTWSSNRSRWESTATSIAQGRNSAVSPARKRSIAQPEPSQQFVDSSSTFFPVSRPSAVGQALVAKPSQPNLDPTSTNFTSARRADPLATNNFSNFGFGPVDPSPRADASTGSWPDAASVHSPTDVTNSDYFPSSNTPSRSGSLPPSRHGNEPVQFGQTAESSYQRFAQPGQRAHASFSAANGRVYPERSGSIQSDIMTFSRMNLDHDPDPGTMSHRPSINMNNAFSPAMGGATLARDAYGDQQPLGRADEANYMNTGSFTPNGYANGQVNPAITFRPINFDSHSHSAPNGTGVRQSPHYSNTHTPPTFDHLYPSRQMDNQTLANTNNLAVVQNKLQNYQQLHQDRRSMMNPNQMHPQQLQQYVAAQQLRNNYPFQYPTPSALPMHVMSPNMMPVPYVAIDPPKGPRGDVNAVELGAMSAQLLNFKRDSKVNKRIELSQIYGHIVEFSGDQHGSRFIQQKLESANSDEKDKVFRELQENSLQLMQDVFGNYVIQKFFEHGDQTQKKFLANRMKGHVLDLACGMYGCRVVQKALEYVLVDQQAWIVKELEKDVLRCVRDNNGNHVIQKVIERVPIDYIGNIIEAFRGQVGSLATNSFGCRVVQRLLEKCPEPQRRFILAELHAEGPKLISDQYGNYVTQHILEYGLPEDRAKVITAVRAALLTFSKHKFASNVVEKCLQYGTDEQSRDIMLTIIERNERGENMLPTLIKDGYGNYVIQKLMDRLARRDYDEMVSIVKPELEKAKKIISGKQIISVEKKMHRFDRIDTPADEAATTDNPPTPSLTSAAQSPRSSSLPSATTSTVDEPVHISPSSKDLATPPGIVNIVEPEHTS